ncbi:MAG: amino acid adenylation domain-containing protein [Spirochaetales bacterium]|nr:amino acid adenylation domain-containing protein [Spirochaetales bacterium]
MRLVTDYLDNSVTRFPDKIAFEDGNRKIKFCDFQIESKNIAIAIVKRNLFKHPVVIFLDKTIECLTCMFGVLYSGNFYTIIDTQMPKDRIEKIFETLKPKIVLTDSVHVNFVKELLQDDCIIVINNIEKSIQSEFDILSEQHKKILDTDVAYVLFTSGSTGIPKGVIISHKSVIAYTEWVRDTFDFNENSIIGNQTPFYFSMSVTDIFATVSSSATMYIIPKQLFTFPVKLLEYIAERKINTIYWVPSALCLVANLKALGKRDISCIKKVLFAGEPMPVKQFNMWKKILPDALFANLFGPTETTDICNYYIVKREFSNNESIPIGDACNNCESIILNENNERVAKNEQGELCVRGSFLAYGYYNNPEKTNEVFVQNPLNNTYREIIYRTGDIVKYNDRNELIYLGRKDFQIKHMGHRIELGEIETSVSAVEGVEQNCCLYNIEKSKIILFYTGKVQVEDIINSLKKSLPEYMIPNNCVKLDSMPYNLNGKIDRSLLKKSLEEK